MSQEAPPGPDKVAPLILLFAILGLPLVAYLWETLNELMSGFVDPVRLAVSLPLLLVFAGLLLLLARRVRRLDERQPD